MSLRRKSGVYALFIIFFASLAYGAPSLTLGSASGAAGTQVQIPVTFDSGGASVTTFQFDVTLPPYISPISASAGPILNSSGKTVVTSQTNGVWRFLIFGLNNNTIGTGSLLTAQISIAGIVAAGSVTIPISNAVYSDAQGNLIPAGTLTGGILTIQDSSTPNMTLPTPDLSSLDNKTFTTQDQMNLTYDAVVTGFDWTFSELSNTASASAVPAASSSAGVPGAQQISTPSPALQLAGLNLAPGRYHITVMARRGAATSAPAQATVTLVQADLGAVRVYPNPWRNDRHSGGITFDNLTGNVTIKIFTVAGHVVNDLSGSGFVTWDLKTKTGDTAASGIYIYLITDSQGRTTKGKIAIAR